MLNKLRDVIRYCIPVFVFMGSLLVIACAPLPKTPPIAETPTPNTNSIQTAIAKQVIETLTAQALHPTQVVVTEASPSQTPALNSPSPDDIATAVAAGIRQTLTAQALLVPPTPYPTFPPLPTATEIPTKVPPRPKPAQQGRVRYWIECDPDGTARIFVFTDPWSWPQVNLYSSMSGPKGEMSIAGGDIQPKIVNPHNKGVNSVDYTLETRFSDGHEETHDLHYRYPSGCYPTQQ